MSNPQQPEIGRSRKTPAQNPDAAAGVIEGQKQPGTGGPEGPVPEDNQPGHHPAEEQDKPDLQAFAERMGTAPPENRSDPDRPTERSPVAAVSSAVQSKRSQIGLGAVLAGVGVVAGLMLLKKRRRSRS
jgi:hypothetical protein